MTTPSEVWGDDPRLALDLLRARLDAQVSAWDRQLNRAAAVMGLAIGAAVAVAGVWAGVGESPGVAGWLAIGAVVGTALITAALAFWVYMVRDMQTVPEPETVRKLARDPSAEREACNSVEWAIRENRGLLGRKAALNGVALWAFGAEFVAALVALFVLVLETT